jgi:hypothetical protein
MELMPGLVQDLALGWATDSELDLAQERGQGLELEA